MTDDSQGQTTRASYSTGRVKTLQQISLCLLTFAVGMSCDSSSNSDTVNRVEPASSNVLSVFDVPSLIGKNIDEVRRVLGHPADKTPEPRSSQFDEWDNVFHKRGYTVLVMFNPKTREVIDFFIPTNDPSEKTSDYTNLLKVSNVSMTNRNYLVTPVQVLGYPGEYTGITITKK